MNEDRAASLDPSTPALPPWGPPFLAALQAGQTVVQACASAGITVNVAYYSRRHNPQVHRLWEEAVQQHTPPQQRRYPAAPQPGWQARFLQALQAGHTPTAASRLSDVSKSMAYLARQRDSAFRAAWAAACPPTTDTVPADWQAQLLELVTSGTRLRQATKALGLTAAYLTQARATDPAFAAALNAVLAVRKRRPAGSWDTAFLAALQAGETVGAASARVGISPITAYRRRRRDAKFRAAWEELAPFIVHAPPAPRGWQALFLQVLAETGNVWQAARRVPITLPRVYEARQRDPAFRTAWDEIVGQQPTHDG